MKKNTIARIIIGTVITILSASAGQIFLIFMGVFLMFSYGAAILVLLGIMVSYLGNYGLLGNSVGIAIIAIAPIYAVIEAITKLLNRVPD